ncbi:MAG: tetratricopeptide repeat protein [Nitrospinae bacterium]|nr:tetratricopeptide repeat protein [Nitrospinota bacterium]
MSRPMIQIFVVGLFLILAGCEGGGNGGEDPVVPSGVTDPAELTQHAFQKQEIGAYEEAVEILNRALEIDPKFIPAHYRMGMVYEEWDRRKDAIAAYQQVLQLDPRHLDARLRLASVYGKSFKNELAIMEYEKAAELKPSDPEIQFKIALEYWYIQKLPKTAEHYRKVIALNPDHLQAHLNLASVYERMKEWDPAFREIETAMTIAKKTGNSQALSIAENKLLILKGGMNLTEEDLERKTKPPFK